MANTHTDGDSGISQMELPIAVLVGIMVSTVGVIIVALTPFAQRVICWVLWLFHVPEEVFLSLASTSSLLLYPNLWVPYTLWGGVAGAATAWLAKGQRRRTEQVASLCCLLALLVQRGWFTGFVITLTRLPEDWRSGVLDIAGLALELSVASLLILGMSKWLDHLYRPVHDFLHYGR